MKSYWLKPLMLQLVALMLLGIPIYPKLMASGSYTVKVQGYIHDSGSGINRTVILKDKTNNSYRLCNSPVSKKMLAFLRMHASAQAVKKSTCWHPQSFNLEKTPRGTEPIYGKIHQEKEGYVVKSQSRDYALKSLPKRLLPLHETGKVLVLDIVQAKGSEKYNIIYSAVAPANYQ